jgi:hypothetical protein
MFVGVRWSARRMWPAFVGAVLTIYGAPAMNMVVDPTRASSRYYTCKILGHQRSSSIVLQ